MEAMSKCENLPIAMIFCSLIAKSLWFAVGEQRHAPGRLGFACVLLAADNCLAIKSHTGLQRGLLFGLVELGIAVNS
jgi:hypothetical protein